MCYTFRDLILTVWGDGDNPTVSRNHGELEHLVHAQSLHAGDGAVTSAQGPPARRHGVRTPAHCNQIVLVHIKYTKQR